jgi:hypothetical protein
MKPIIFRLYSRICGQDCCGDAERDSSLAIPIKDQKPFYEEKTEGRCDLSLVG